MMNIEHFVCETQQTPHDQHNIVSLTSLMLAVQQIKVHGSYISASSPFQILHYAIFRWIHKDQWPF